jgi:hypothetical protein
VPFISGLNFQYRIFNIQFPGRQAKVKVEIEVKGQATKGEASARYKGKSHKGEASVKYKGKSFGYRSNNMGYKG